MDSVHASAHALRTHSIGGQVESSGFRFEVQVKHISLTNKQKTHTTHAPSKRLPWACLRKGALALLRHLREGDAFEILFEILFWIREHLCIHVCVCV